MKGDCVSDFRDGHGEQGFDVATGRSTSPVRVHEHEPIYQLVLSELNLTRTMAAWLHTQGWNIFLLPAPMGVKRKIEMRNYRKVASGYLVAFRRVINSSEAIDEPQWDGIGSDTLVQDIANFDPTFNKPNYTFSQNELRGYNSEERKAVPIHAFMTGYFPDALWALARLSKKANDKHNPGEPMHWARGKSTDQLECAQRHLFTPFEIDPETEQPELAAVAWRALAELQLYEEKRLLREGVKPLSGVTE
jgi:hypothetical protein